MGTSPITLGVGNGAQASGNLITSTQGVAPPAQNQPSWAHQAEFVICDQTIELGFRALKGLGWRWRHLRRTDPRRTARHWLVLAVATLWVLAHGTRAEDARRVGVAPARLRTPPVPPDAGRRTVSLFRLGVQCLRRLLGRGRLWRRLWLVPEPWPQPPPDLVVYVHRPAEP